MTATHTPGPWVFNARTMQICGPYTQRGVRPYIADVLKDGPGGDPYFNGRLLAAGPDHSLIARALCLGLARWEPFTGDGDQGEVCVGGLRWATRKDEFGVPEVHHPLRAALGLALTGAGW